MSVRRTWEDGDQELGGAGAKEWKEEEEEEGVGEEKADGGRRG